ncbi:MAG: hypothetical protein QOI11_1762 [Candidatus Eremiobacteraeota bacterium]|jgi:hypothetical protein|nr:hypothetical protein [Candidatus Eremiobacteraeota bacterium]
MTKQPFRAAFCDPLALRGLAYLRIGIAAVLLTKFCCESRYLLEFYGSTGLTSWTITDAVLPPYAPRLNWLRPAFEAFRLSDDRALVAFATLYAALLVLLLLGYRTRLTAPAAWLGHLVLNNTGSLSSYGLDQYANIALFYCAIAPCGAVLSLDALRRGTAAAGGFWPSLVFLVLRLNFALSYLGAGLAKAQGPQWWSGEAIWRAVMQPQFHAAYLQWSWLPSVPLVAQLVCWGTLVVELGYAVFIWPARTRPVWLLAAIGMHAGIALALGLWLFASVMIVMNVALFAPQAVDAVLARLASYRPAWAALSASPAATEESST